MIETFTSDFARTFVPNDDTITFSGTGDTGYVSRANDDTVIANGVNQAVNLSITGGVMAILDQGKGLNLGINEGVADVTVQGFQNDPMAHVTLAVPSATPSLTSDDNGGTLLTLQGNGVPGTVIDFIADPSLTAAQISGGSQPALTASTAQPTYVMNAASNAFTQPSASSAAFVLDGASSNLQLGLSNSTTMVFGHGDTVTLTGGGVIRDKGDDTHITFGADTTAIVYGAYWDLGSTLQQSGVTAAALAASIRPDGHGGTLIGTGATSVDLMYDTYVRPNQLVNG